MYSAKLGCGHFMHSACIKSSGCGFEKCAGCQGLQAQINEPITYNGHDYVNDPTHKIVWIRTGEPFVWFANKSKSVKWMICEKEWGLQRLLASGVTIDDFLKNGYGWEDLKHFRDVRERPQMALRALGCNAEHFRDYAVLLPVAQMALTGRDMAEYFSFAFVDEDKPPMVVGGRNQITWKCCDILKLGMKFDDLIYAGISTTYQFDTLESTEEEEAKLEITAESFATLKSPVTPPAPRVEPVESPESSPPPAPRVAARNPEPVMVDSPESSPPPAPRVAARIPKPAVLRMHALKKK
jgi:hypothetical protein